MNSPQLKENLEVSKMLLFAPGFLSDSTLLLGGFITSLFPNMKINGGDYNYSYAKTYHAKKFKPLFEVNNQLKKIGIQKANIPTLVFISDNDETIDSKKLFQHAKSELPNWEIYPIYNHNNEEKDKDLFHMITLKEYADHQEWKRMEIDINLFIND